MKVLFVVDSFRGGAGNVIQILASEFQKRGHQSIIFIGDGKLANPKYDMTGVKVIDFHLNHNVKAKTPVDRIIKQSNIFRRLFKVEKPDVVVSFLSRNNVLCCLAKTKGIPLFVSERIDPAKADLPVHWRFLRWLTYGRANRVILQCSNFASFCGGKFKKITEIVPNPILKPKALHCVNAVNDKTVFISMGRLSEQKNFPWMFEQMKQIHDRVPNSVLHIYGNGEEKDNLNRIIHEKGMESYIQIVGYADEPYHILAEADVYFMTSDTEGFPNALSEAMAVGLPSVSRCCHEGIGDLVQDGINGYLVGMEDKNAFVERAVALARDPELRAQISMEARKVSDTYSVEVIIDRWENMLKESIMY